MVVELLPGDVIQLRLYGQRSSSAVARSIPKLYYELIHLRVAARKAERRKARQLRKKK